ncbi:deoxyribodipyrimidine photo-lyase [soil metagenome]
MGTGLVWLRRDLRLRDHPALSAALDAHDRVVPVFVFDERLLHGRHESGARTQFLLECLGELDADLRERGSGLVVRHGKPEEELPELAEKIGAAAVHFTKDVSPFARKRGERTHRALKEMGVSEQAHPGVNAVDDLTAIRTKTGKPYTVFTPFFKNWLDVERRDVLNTPAELPGLPSGLDKGRLPSLESLGLEQEVSDPPPGGEKAALARLERFLDGPIDDYKDNHDALGRDRTSRLSPYLHFGCVSVRQIEQRLPSDNTGPAAFHRQLCWRDFYHHVLLHFPRNARSEYQERYRGEIKWSYAKKPFEAWCEGRTGFPLVDAGMRQLLGEGWMHNRARLVVGSFLTKDLGIDWRWGERHFMRYLVDGDEANNNGNWQWIASVGTDPQPAFKRIFNPSLHQERYDPDGTYVRSWVPELREVPDERLREPWKMDPDEQKAAGCVIGEDYPAPIVDHAEARREALERYRVG